MRIPDGRKVIILYPIFIVLRPASESRTRGSSRRDGRTDNRSPARDSADGTAEKRAGTLRRNRKGRESDRTAFRGTGRAFAGVAADTVSAVLAAGNRGSRRTKIAAACTDMRSTAPGKAWAAAYTVSDDTARSTAALAGKEKDGTGRPRGSPRKTRSIGLTNRISPRFRHAPDFQVVISICGVRRGG